jgi:hypothetical protein
MKEGNHLRDVVVEGRIILKWILKTFSGQRVGKCLDSSRSE